MLANSTHWQQKEDSKMRFRTPALFTLPLAAFLSLFGCASVAPAPASICEDRAQRPVNPLVSLLPPLPPRNPVPMNENDATRMCDTNVPCPHPGRCVTLDGYSRPVRICVLPSASPPLPPPTSVPDGQPDEWQVGNGTSKDPGLPDIPLQDTPD